MGAADTMTHNGLLTIQEIQNELGHGDGSTASIQYGKFYTWLMEPQARSTPKSATYKANWKKFDLDHDGRISLGELEYAVAEWLGEDKSIRAAPPKAAPL